MQKGTSFLTFLKIPTTLSKSFSPMSLTATAAVYDPNSLLCRSFGDFSHLSKEAWNGLLNTKGLFKTVCQIM
jgi:hypothetical protein